MSLFSWILFIFIIGGAISIFKDSIEEMSGDIEWGDVWYVTKKVVFYALYLLLLPVFLLFHREPKPISEKLSK